MAELFMTTLTLSKNINVSKKQGAKLILIIISESLQ